MENQQKEIDLKRPKHKLHKNNNLILKKVGLTMWNKG
jgi:hypothetical protein